MGKGRPATTNSLLRNLKKQSSKSKGVVSNMFIPNHSGDHSAGNVSETPSNDNDLVNKKYVDDNVVGNLAVTSTQTIENERIVTGDTGPRRVQNSGVSISDANDITDVNDLTIDNDLDVKGESKGSRVLITAGQSANIVGTTKYMRVGNCLLSGTKGLPMTRAGSIVGLGVMINCSSFDSSQSFTYICYKNGVNVFSGTFTIEGTGVVTHETTQARGIDTFVAGDVISLAGMGHVTYTINDTIMTLELQLDT